MLLKFHAFKGNHEEGTNMKKKKACKRRVAAYKRKQLELNINKEIPLQTTTTQIRKESDSRFLQKKRLHEINHSLVPSFLYFSFLAFVLFLFCNQMIIVSFILIQGIVLFLVSHELKSANESRVSSKKSTENFEDYNREPQPMINVGCASNS